MRDEAEKRIGHLYPRIEVTAAMAADRPDLERYVDRKLTVIAWLWARTVRSPNPAFANVEVPLASTFILSKKKGKEAYVDPVIEDGGYRFTVKAGAPPESAKKGTKLSRGSNFQCVMSGVPMNPDFIRSEGMAGRMGSRLMAIVAEGDRGRVYLEPTACHEETPRAANPSWRPMTPMPDDRRWFSPPPYGMPNWADLFTDRQLVALTTFSDLVGEARDRIRLDAAAAGLPDDGVPLREGGTGATAYAEAVSVYLGSLLQDVNQIAICTPRQCVVGTMSTLRCEVCSHVKLFLWSGTMLKVTCSAIRQEAIQISLNVTLKGFHSLGYGSGLVQRRKRMHEPAVCLIEQDNFHRSALLRQHWLRRPF